MALNVSWEPPQSGTTLRARPEDPLKQGEVSGWFCAHKLSRDQAAWQGGKTGAQPSISIAAGSYSPFKVFLKLGSILGTETSPAISSPWIIRLELACALIQKLLQGHQKSLLPSPFPPPQHTPVVLLLDAAQ